MEPSELTRGHGQPFGSCVPIAARCAARITWRRTAAEMLVMSIAEARDAQWRSALREIGVSGHYVSFGGSLARGRVLSPGALMGAVERAGWKDNSGNWCASRRRAAGEAS